MKTASGSAVLLALRRHPSMALERLFGRLAVAGPSRLPALARTASTSATTLDAAPSDAPRWTPGAQRIGVLARKRGMTTMFDEHGERVPATVLQVSELVVEFALAQARRIVWPIELSGVSAPVCSLDAHTYSARRRLRVRAQAAAAPRRSGLLDASKALEQVHGDHLRAREGARFAAHGRV